MTTPTPRDIELARDALGFDARDDSRWQVRDVSRAIALARAEEREACQCKPTMWWEYDCDVDDAPVDDPADIADRLDIGTVFRLQAAHALPDQFYVCEVDAKNRTVARPATPEEIEGWHINAKVQRERSKVLPRTQGAPDAR